MSEKIVLVTTDLSENSKKAFSEAISEAKNRGARAVALLVSAPFELPVVLHKQLAPGQSMESLSKLYEEEQKKCLSEFLTQSGVAQDLHPEVLFTSSDPGAEIVKHAANIGASLIVIASQGKDSLGKWILGSTAEKVISRAPCPVLVIPPLKG